MSDRSSVPAASDDDIRYVAAAQSPVVVGLDLPPWLVERTRWCGRLRSLDSGVESAGEYVLYWMRTAVRTDENPALDVARWVAARQGLPLLIYQGLSDDYEYASDRHHRFMLEGARDVQRQCQTRGWSYAFHLTTRDDQEPRLVQLAQQAAWVITEDMPVDPPRRFLRALVRQSSVPVLVVDTACVLPMQVVGRAYGRAFEYRQATEAEYRRRVARSWPELDLAAEPLSFPVERLPFQPLELQHADLGQLIARCRIDHAVGPIAGTPGGSTAGYQRWENFRRRGLRDYAKRRNQPLDDGVSRMSAYLHYGMVSPLRIAREADAAGHAGGEKFLDELLIWRELAYCYCCYTPNYDRWESLPSWARATLQEHARDPRPEVYSWEALARAQTSDALWNAAQESLLVSGELHNNVRMTWGKALLQWAATPQQALAWMIDLNHRYALDGRDPASYGGLLWCLGLFDRPFSPAQPIYGTVRPRPTDEHARRLDVQRYQRRVRQLHGNQQPTVAVIGAGLAGLFAARTLADHGLAVTVFEKSRGLGGRMSTRWCDDGTTFDHGAQYFTARDGRFQRYVESWIADGLVAEWPVPPGKIVTFAQGSVRGESQSQRRFVGVPGMTAIGRHLADGLSVQLKTTVAAVQRETADSGAAAVSGGSAVGGWTLFDDQQRKLGCFDRLVVALPAPQAAVLLAAVEELAPVLGSVELRPCWAVMAELPQTLVGQWAGAFVHESPLGWVSRNGTKPGRRVDGESLVLHATADWTQDHWDDSAEEVAAALLMAFWQASGAEPQVARTLLAHRWRYAIPAAPLEVECLSDASGTLFVAGDWCAGARVEGAFLSGMAAAGRVLNSCQAAAPKESLTQMSLF